ncbi:MAG: TIR domain-containing protein [Paraburkholderia tropica]|uniref:TIR domain-containing protein n=1 Tax=Paraburkholderia tropica TaxID=92647 RepID=UPI003100B674
MARQTFFSFRYRNDNWRAAIVRNSWVTQDRKASGFFDSAKWEEVKKKTDEKIAAWIDEQLKGTSVTVVLIGADTAGKKWIKHEIVSSHKKGNGLLGIYVHGIKNSDGQLGSMGANPFTDFRFTKEGKEVVYPVYDWIADNGYTNLGKWIEAAATAAGR